MLLRAVPPIGAVSPSLYSRLRACPLRVYFDRSIQARPQSAARAATLGNLVHRALEILVTTAGIRQTDVRAAAESAWTRAAAEIVGSQSPDQLPGYYLKAARYLNSATRLQRLLAPYPMLEPELPLTSADGEIAGRCDLVAASDTDYIVIDYKSGIEREPGTGEPLVADHANQLKIYAALLAESRGLWPRVAYLLPLDGPEIPVGIDSADCLMIAQDARDRAASFNQALPDPPEGDPAPAACRWCAHTLQCAAYKSAVSERWGDAMLSAFGTLTAVETSLRGGVAIQLRVAGGSTAHGRISVAHINMAIHPEIAVASVGDEVSVTGLYRGPLDGSYGIRDTGRLSLKRREPTGPVDPI